MTLHLSPAVATLLCTWKRHLIAISPTCIEMHYTKSIGNFERGLNQGWGVEVEESEHFWGFRSQSRQKLADS